MDSIDIVLPDGSMQEVIMRLFEKAGLPITLGKRRTKEGHVKASWIGKVLFQRPQEIPHYLNSGHFDIAIVGEDWVSNWGYDFPLLLKLAIGRGGNKSVRIVLAVSELSQYKQVADLPLNCEIATEYVELARKFFASADRSDIKVLPSFGNTEQKVKFGATGIIDVTESGASLEDNNLRILCEVMESHTVVVANPKSLEDSAKQPLLSCLTRLIKGAHQANQFVMITANVPERVIDHAAVILKGLKGATKTPLTTSHWFSLSSVVCRDDEVNVIFQLLRIGVTDILVNRDIPLIMS